MKKEERGRRPEKKRKGGKKKRDKEVGETGEKKTKRKERKGKERVAKESGRRVCAAAIMRLWHQRKRSLEMEIRAKERMEGETEKEEGNKEGRQVKKEGKGGNAGLTRYPRCSINTKYYCQLKKKKERKKASPQEKRREEKREGSGGSKVLPKSQRGKKPLEKAMLCKGK